MRRRSFLGLGAAALTAGMQTSRLSAREGLRFEGRYVWRRDDPAFGGFSAIETWARGTRFLAVTDRGDWLEGRMRRNADGSLQALEAGPLTRLLDPEGRPLSGEMMTDAEGLARASDGRIYVSFERRHRVWAYAAPGARARPLPEHADFPGLQTNSGLEALAIDGRGVLYAIPERSGMLERPFPVYRFRSGEWDIPFTLPRRGTFLVTGADIGPDARLYVLERDVILPLGFASRVRRFRMGALGLEDEEEVMVSRAGRYDNLEGISVWRAQSGRLWITLISDDNFRWFQRTEIVEYSLPG